MQWFKHDTDAATDAKIKKLVIKYGAIGYAIYFHCLELIMGDIGETNITFELEHDSEIIADNLRIQGTADKSAIAIVEEVMRYIVALRLFDEVDGHIFCFKLLKRLDLSMTSNPRLRKMITEAKGNHDNVMMRHDTVMLEENRRDKKRIEENREESASALPSPIDSNKVQFGEFRRVFLKQEEYDKLSKIYPDHIAKQITALDSYLENHPQKKYKSHYATIIGWMNKDDIKPKPIKHYCKSCDNELLIKGPNAGTCQNDECAMYHRRQE